MPWGEYITECFSLMASHMLTLKNPSECRDGMVQGNGICLPKGPRYPLGYTFFFIIILATLEEGVREYAPLACWVASPAACCRIESVSCPSWSTLAWLCFCQCVLDDLKTHKWFKHFNMNIYDTTVLTGIPWGWWDLPVTPIHWFLLGAQNSLL